MTCVHPGATRTELTPELIARRSAAEAKPGAEIERELATETAIGRMVTAHDVAWLVCFLASPRSVGRVIRRFAMHFRLSLQAWHETSEAEYNQR